MNNLLRALCLLACMSWTWAESSNFGDSYRLPASFAPVSYDLFITPFIYEPHSKSFETFLGSEEIRVMALTSTDRIILHQNDLDITEIKILSEEGFEIQYNFALYDDRRDFLIIVVGPQNRLQAGSEYRIRFSWTGKMRTDARGLYLAHYQTQDNKTVYLASTKLEATFARSVFPCFDEPIFKATFTMKIARRTDTDRNYVALFNAPFLRSEKIDDRWTVDIFDVTPPMASYLVAFVIADYVDVDTGYVDGIRYSTLAQHDKMEEARLGHVTGLTALDWLESNLAPPLRNFVSKIDTVTLPQLSAGAMENWGLVTFSNDFLYSQGRDPIWKPAWIVDTVAHELIHQWFGNIVTPRWWDSLWLSEGFANYFMYYISEIMWPENRESEIRVAHSVLEIMREESLKEMHPLTYSVQTPKEIQDSFDSILYWKGGAIVRMMHFIMGEHFLPALGYYLTKHALGNVEYKDLLQALDEYASTRGLSFNMAARMEPWIVQSGYPVVSVRHKGDKLTFSQHRFRLSQRGPTETGLFGDRYDVPIMLTNSVERNFDKGFSDILWLDKDSELTVLLDGQDSQAEWVVANMQHMGYYRVNYDIDNWLRLSQQLLDDPDMFDPLLRGTLIDDAFSLQKAGMLDLITALEITRYLGRELSYPGWRSFARHCSSILRMVRGTPVQERFENYVREISGSSARTLTFEVDGDFPYYDTFVRVWVATVACGTGEDYCTNKAVQEVERWISHPDHNPININFREVFYCAALRCQTEPYFSFLYSAAYEAHVRGDAVERERLVHALACSTDQDILQWLMEKALDQNHFVSWHSKSILDWVSVNPAGRNLALDFFVDNIVTIQHQAGFHATSVIAGEVTKYFNWDSIQDTAQFGCLETAVQNLRHSTKWHHVVEDIHQTMKDNAQWFQKNYDALDKWLG